MNLNELKAKLKEIKDQGEIETLRSGNTGVGYTLECLLGIEENNDSSADIDGTIELKAKRKGSSARTTSFTQSPIWLKKTREIIKKYGLNDLKIISFERKFGKKLDQLLKSEKFSHLKPCNICGVLRRYLMNKYSKGYDKLITGHNLDDESQAIMMNFFRAQTEVQAKLGPVTGVKKNKLFTQRVKPLYFCSEKEVATYALLMGFGVGFTECPYVGESYRAQIRDLLNDLGSEVKKNVVHKFINNLEVIKSSVTIEGEVGKCDSCGEPAKREVCNACKLIGMIE